MAVRAQFENSNEYEASSSSWKYTDAAIRVGVFSTLTNSYAIVAIGASENFYRYSPALSTMVVEERNDDYLRYQKSQNSSGKEADGDHLVYLKQSCKM
jgi:hypothetical protein